MNSKHGIVLVEAIIALSILVVGLGALFTLTANSIGLAASNSDQFIATHLAVEGMELVKYMLEKNYVDAHFRPDGSEWSLTSPSFGRPWDFNIMRTGPAGRRCFEIDYRFQHDSPTSLGLLNVPQNDPQTNPSGGPDLPRRPCANFIQDQSEYRTLYYHPPGNSCGDPPGYNYAASSCAVQTQFRRVIAINPTTVSGLGLATLEGNCATGPPGQPQNCQKRVAVLVSWTTRGGARKYVHLEAVYFDWKSQCSDRRDNDGDANTIGGGIDATGAPADPNPDPDCVDVHDNDEFI